MRLLFLALGSNFAFTQATTLHTQSNVVLIPALVKDQKGAIVYGLQPKDFVIADDGIAQTVQLDEAAEAPPVSLVIAMRRGRRANYEFPRIRGLSALLDPLLGQGQARIALVEFDSRVEVTREFTTDPALITDDLANLEAGDGGAAILDAVSFAQTLLEKESAEREKVLLLIRMALGSQRSGILGLVFTSAAKLAIAGCAVGLIGAAAASRLLQSFLFGVSPFDPLVLTLAATFVLMLALAASSLPARRAASIDPMNSLRAD